MVERAVPSAPVIVSNEPGSFPRSVLEKRHPALIRQVLEAFPYGPEQYRALDVLLGEITEGVIEPLGEGAHDRESWAEWGRGNVGRSWFDVPFLWSESFFYRKLLEAVGYFAPGPWQGIDPFAPFKQAELDSPVVDEELEALDGLSYMPVEERADALLHASLWGNRADLGFRLEGGDPESAAEPALVADDRARLWSLLDGDGTVGFVADNAGRELVPDLVLIDFLLNTGKADGVVLHVKPYPYYVSDATTADVVHSLRRLRAAAGEAGRAGVRLWQAMEDGRLRVRAHSFWCAPLPYDQMPDDLVRGLAATALTIVKGDLNYRRLVGDRRWPAGTAYEDLTSYFPGPVAALRTLKSDVIVGVGEKAVSALDATGTPWRTGGTHALVQVRR